MSDLLHGLRLEVGLDGGQVGLGVVVLQSLVLNQLFRFRSSIQFHKVCSTNTIQGDQMNMAVIYGTLEKIRLVYTCTVAYTGQVTFYKVREKHGHVLLVTLYLPVNKLQFFISDQHKVCLTNTIPRILSFTFSFQTSIKYLNKHNTSNFKLHFFVSDHLCR